VILTRFPVGYCQGCAREVMLYSALDDAGELELRCLHCERQPGAVVAVGEPVRWLNSQAVGRLGYSVEGEDEPKAAPAGCGKPGCGQGTCRNSGKKHPFSS
jgi:hypothetical protein